LAGGAGGMCRGEHVTGSSSSSSSCIRLANKQENSLLVVTDLLSFYKIIASPLHLLSVHSLLQLEPQRVSSAVAAIIDCASRCSARRAVTAHVLQHHALLLRAVGLARQAVAAALAVPWLLMSCCIMSCCCTLQGSLAKLPLQLGGLAAVTAVHCVLGVGVLALLAINRVRHMGSCCCCIVCMWHLSASILSVRRVFVPPFWPSIE
jgi:hypothetical protein